MNTLRAANGKGRIRETRTHHKPVAVPFVRYSRTYNRTVKRALNAVRGLVLGLSISFMNLVGLFFMLLLLGGLGEWTTMQFVGAFGVFEVATAIAFLFCPNVWRMPVIQSDLAYEGKSTDVHLAASTVFIPHWAGGAKAIAGGACLIAAARSEGLGVATLGLVPFSLLVAALVVAVSVAAARFGTARPDLDVVYFIIRRPKHDDSELPGISISASTLQIVLGAFTLPTVKLLPPATLYQPEIGPSAGFLLSVVLATAVSVTVALFAWRGRLTVRAPRPQQRKAEEPA